jgi:hypothetical protein
MEEDVAENSALVQDPPVSHGLMFLLRLQAYRLFFPAAKVWDASKNVKGNFLKTPDGIFSKSFLRMRSVLLIVYALRFLV